MLQSPAAYREARRLIIVQTYLPEMLKREEF